MCVYLKYQYTKTGQADWERNQVFSQPAMEVAERAPLTSAAWNPGL